jgi:hypothetical protein
MEERKMKRSKPAVKYQGFALEIPLIEQIKEKIKDNDNYRSVTDYVRIAIQEKMQIDQFGFLAKQADTITKISNNVTAKMTEDYQKQIMELQKTVIELQKGGEIGDKLDQILKILKEKNGKHENGNGHGLT